MEIFPLFCNNWGSGMVCFRREQLATDGSTQCNVPQNSFITIEPDNKTMLKSALTDSIGPKTGIWRCIEYKEGMHCAEQIYKIVCRRRGQAIKNFFETEVCLKKMVLLMRLATGICRRWQHDNAKRFLMYTWVLILSEVFPKRVTRGV